MANSTTGNVWVLDTVGIITESPVKIKKIVISPNAAGDSVTFLYWNPGTGNSGLIRSTASAATTTVASASQIQSTGNFTTAKAVAGDVIKITKSNTGSNLVSRLIASVDSDNQVTVTPADITNEAGSVYSWTIYKSYTAAYVLTPGTEKVQTEMDFGDGVWFPTLAMSAKSANAVIHVYIA